MDTLKEDLMKNWSNIVFQERASEITPRIRVLRALEEMIELSQAEDITFEEIDIIKNQVYSKPKSEPFNELGGVMVTIAGYAATRNLSIEDAFWTEFKRMMNPEIIEKVRYRNLEGDKIGFNKVS